jgi:transposase
MWWARVGATCSRPLLANSTIPRFWLNWPVGGSGPNCRSYAAALEGRVEAYHRFLLERLLAHIDFLEQSIAIVQQEIQQRLKPYEDAAELLRSIPTLQEAAIATIISEIGVDMSTKPHVSVGQRR